ncbi:MAG: type I-E CRISPR-associated protein Cas5/CasD [Blastocatellia bacterium]|nr:type I-E CRISPR-associated protein Cas5/CasD [Blastocatellia bacterium]
MKQTLLLRLAGPMQSWGTQSRFSIRDTGLEPSKSGVFGLLCAALGAQRDDTETLQQLRENLVMGVRVDREGVMKKDFHTAKDVAKANGSGTKDTEISDRWYLADADFLVGLESGDAALLHKLNDALVHPVWQIFLGRKSFVPSRPVRVLDTPLNASLRDVLKSFEWKQGAGQTKSDRLRIVVDATLETATEVRQDVPLSFAERRFTIRYVLTDLIPIPKGGV